ncbi:hypothetical protein PseudUWO311_00890 [Pseudanabaena sp. UWO311]|uniref:hypothetical protein n=1 Tax=Pseudanabaena sp. UWO311 TaxID=2487337 RepID=UPI0011571658|nr:hypothetical protein [Pseudanabaena sp. UWO311]TYQ29484.1 hypothetical protein PseudUWO311_00890 [Pseudanabaena sp. UWO311]
MLRVKNHKGDTQQLRVCDNIRIPRSKITEDSRDTQVRSDIVDIAEAFNSSNLVSDFLLLLPISLNSR